ncbi:MAG: CDP-alcohol phosphatidyltransferase family protein [Spirochaetes bacterium]|nr:CDP-alcohol phosphatidyltransferase family protein [Spirochaetota bacterium]
MNIKDKINVANILTFSRIILGFVFFILFLLVKFNENLNQIDKLIINSSSFLIFIVAIITDGLDGYFARKNDEVSDFGKHFDPLADSIFFIIVFWTFYVINLMPIYFFLIILFREGYMHIYLRPSMKKKGKSLPANIYGKLKTVFQSVFSLIIIFMLIINQILLLLYKDMEFLEKLPSVITRVSYVLFAIIVVLSIFSLGTYVFPKKRKV